MAGYSGTPLPKKLGIKEDSHVVVLNAPSDFRRTLGPLSPRARLFNRLPKPRSADVILLFVTKQSDLARRFPAATSSLKPAGGLWVVWPKRASGVPTDVTEDTARAVALAAGLVDNKVCAVDETWSGLRCVIRLVNRPKHFQEGP